MITVTSLRKIFTEQGIKGAGKWNREIFDSLTNQAWDAALEEDAARKPVKLTGAVARRMARQAVAADNKREAREARKATATGRSRAGMVIVAKGTEIHKSETFRAAAEAAGWGVKVIRESYELSDDAEGDGTRFYATAERDGDSISLAWDGRAYDYPNSSALINNKNRKVRNLKEALRLLAA